MLVVTRKNNESIEVTDRETGNVVVTFRVLAVRGNRAVRVGVEAGEHLRILRTEIGKDHGIKTLPEVAHAETSAGHANAGSVPVVDADGVRV